MKRLINIAVRSSICNLRCKYCYLNQKDVWFNNEQIKYMYTPKEVRHALSIERLGGSCLFNFCADGETLLAKDIYYYVKELLEEGHYVEFVTNLTISSKLDEFLSMDRSLLQHLEFKCSFHYLQLKQNGLLNEFANNVKKIWKSGSSACIEMVADDDLLHLIDEIKDFSINNFGALPHLTIARDDRKRHDFLTKLTPNQYFDVWSTFDSQFWRYKMKIANKKVNKYCCAGRFSLYIDLATGLCMQCYKSDYKFNIFEDPDKEIPFCAIGKCKDYFCYNGHALLTCGVVPSLEKEPSYGNLRDRLTISGDHWLNPAMLKFMNTKLVDSNKNYKKYFIKDKLNMKKILIAKVLYKICSLKK